LIEQEERRRRRKILWLFLAFALGAALLYWLLLGHSGLLSSEKPGVGDQNTSIGNTAVKKNSEPILLSDSITISTISQATDKSAQGLTTDKRSSEGSDSGQNSKGSNAGLSRLESQRISKDIDKQPGKHDTSADSVAVKKGASLKKADKQSKIAGVFTPKTIQNGEKVALRTPAKTDALQLNQVPGKDPSNPHQSSTQGVTSPVSTMPVMLVEKVPYLLIFIIPTPIPLFDLPDPIFVPRKIKVPEKAPVAQKTDPVQGKPFSFGLSLAGAAYQQLDTSGFWAGFTVGAFGEYRLNKYWSLMLGGQWRFVPGQNASNTAEPTNPVIVEHLRYSFGYKSELWRRETRGLHMLEIPFSAKWNQGRWGVEGGGAVGALLAVQNKTAYTVSSSLEPEKTTVSKFVKGIKTPYNSINFAAFAGASYQLNHRFSIMTRLNYRFTPVFKTDPEGVKNNGLGNVELGLRVRLF